MPKFNNEFEKIEYYNIPNWCSHKCPYCKNSILVPSDIQRHKEMRCTTAGRTLEEINEEIALRY